MLHLLFHRYYCCLMLLLAGSVWSMPSAVGQPPGKGAITLLMSDGVRLYVEQAGEGVPCVFVHGGPGAGSESFRRAAGNRAERFLHMVYYDQRGSGRSADAPAGQYTMERMVQDLEQVRVQLGVARWVVMAHSFGATIATAYAHQHPERVLGLILVNGVLHPPASLRSTLAYATTLLPDSARPNASLPLMQRFGRTMQALEQQQVTWQLQYSSQRVAARAQRTQPATGSHGFAQAVFSGELADYGMDYSAQATHFSGPLLLLIGQNDKTTGLNTAVVFAHRRVVTIPGKHYSYLERPARFGRVVQRFVRLLI